MTTAGQPASQPQREGRLHALLERLNVGYFRATVYGRLMDCNRALLRLVREAQPGSPEHPEKSDSPDVDMTEICDRVSQSRHFRELLWQGGQPGALDLLRQPGDTAVREIKLTIAENHFVHLIVRLAYSKESDQLLVEGLVEDVTHIPRR